MSEDPFESHNFFTPRSISFTVEDGDPWNSNDIRPLTLSEDVVSKELTAANALIGVDLPEIYDTAYIRAGPMGDHVSIESLETIVGLGGLGPRFYEQMTAIVIPAGVMYVTRNEFNTALALIACTQKNMGTSLQTIYQHRNDLPVPLLPKLELVTIKPNHKPKQSNFDDPWRLSNPTQEHKKKVLPIQREESWFSDLDQITVIAAETEGFLFPHMNYWVQSNQRESSVRRRFSDFYWFWNILMKRYPFRLIPLLPPKKFSGRDNVFMEQRCQGLSRFINCVVQHPVLKNDEIVILFLTEETEFGAWRKGPNVPSSEEEFIRVNPNMEDLKDWIPKDLDSRIKIVQARLPKTIERYDVLCSTMEHLIQLKDERMKELKVYNQTLKELGSIEQTCFIPECQSCPHIVRGYEYVGDHMNEESTIIESETVGVLESLKRHREISTSFLKMLERKSRLQVNQIETLKKKMTVNTAKVNQHRGVPGLESEVERLDLAIQNDTDRIRYQERRDAHIRYCVAIELTYLHKQQAFVSLFYQNYVHQQLQFNRKTIDNWKALEALLCDMPKPEDLL